MTEAAHDCASSTAVIDLSKTLETKYAPFKCTGMVKVVTHTRHNVLISFLCNRLAELNATLGAGSR